MLPPEVDSALDEVTYLRAECIRLIDAALAVCQPDANGDTPDAFRYVVTPFLYAIWERCFTTNFAVMAKLVRHQAASPSAMTIPQAALWLQNEGFFQSLSEQLRQGSARTGDTGKKAIKGSTFRVLADFLANFIRWQKAPTSTAIDPSKLVMTFANVNCEVLDVNAEAIGLAGSKEFQDFRRKVGRLEDLVGRRNDISHGTLINPPGNREFRDLVSLIKDVLIKEFCTVVQLWIIYR